MSDFPKFPALDVSIEQNLPSALDFNLNPSQGALLYSRKGSLRDERGYRKCEEWKDSLETFSLEVVADFFQEHDVTCKNVFACGILIPSSARNKWEPLGDSIVAFCSLISKWKIILCCCSCS